MVQAPSCACAELPANIAAANAPAMSKGLRLNMMASLVVLFERYPLLDPASQFAQHEMRDHSHARLAVVKAGNRGEVLAAVRLENIRVFDRDFLQRLQAVRGE